MHHILVCLDGSALAKRVMPYALAIAQSYGSHITLLHVLEKQHVDPCKPVDPFAWEMERQEAISYLKGIEAKVDSISITSEVIDGKPAEQINDWIHKSNVDLTVLCSHGEKGHSQWALASTTQKLIAGSLCAILLIPASFLLQNESDEVHFQRLLVPLDGSSWAESALPFAINIANVHNAEIVLAHVLPEPGLTHIGPPDAEAIQLENQVEAYNKRVALQYLDKTNSRLRTSLKVPVNSLLINRHGVSDELIKLVESKSIDLVVMSTNGKSSYNEKFCGNITSEFLTNSQVPVIFFRAPILQASNYFSMTEGLSKCAPRLPSRATL